jgi:hypothetical protein
MILGMPWLTQFNPQIDWQRRTLTFRTTPTTIQPSSPPRYTIRILPSEDPQKTTGQRDTLYLITDQKALTRLQKKDDSVQWLCHLEQISGPTQKPSADPTAHLPAAIVSLLQPILKKYADVFPTDLPAGLPPSRTVDHRIILKPNSVPFSRSPPRLAPPELAELKKQLIELLTTG